MTQHSVGVVPEAPEDPEPHSSTEELGLDHLGLGELGELPVPGLDVHTATSTVLARTVFAHRDPSLCPRLLDSLPCGPDPPRLPNPL